jgi:hypothetical protein
VHFLGTVKSSIGLRGDLTKTIEDFRHGIRAQIGADWAQMTVKPLLFMFTLAASTSFANGVSSDAPYRSARLIDEPSSASSVEPVNHTLTFATHFARTLLPAIFGSTAGVIGAVALGSLSNSLLGAAIPVLLVHLLIPPILTVFSALLLGNHINPGRFNFWLPMLGTFLLHAAVFVVGSLVFSIPWTNPLALLAFTVVDGMLMSVTSVGLMHLFQNAATQKMSVIKSFVPGVSDTTFISMWRTQL